MLSVNCGYGDAPQGRLLLSYYGPEIWVDIGFDPKYKPAKNAAPVSQASNLPALVDSGARECCVDSALATQLRLPVHDRRTVSGVNGALEVNFHLAQVHIAKLKLVMRGSFAAVPLMASGFKQQIVLGRSFLSLVRMEYEGPTGIVKVLRD